MALEETATSQEAQEPDEEPDRHGEPVDAEPPPRLTFPVVAIGASAGGLEAYTEFFKSMPSDSGMAFVLIQHLPPQRESMMAEILSKRTKMTVLEVEEGLQLEPNHVYCIHPGNTLTIKDGRFHLGEILEKPGNNYPIDDFFRSLAEEQRQRAIAVVMSGMGSDGSAGAQAIKAVGGLCIAQDPETAKFPSMPRHLMDSAMADFVLRPEEIPQMLIRYAQHPYASGDRGNVNVTLRREQQHFNDILGILRARLRQDFTGYKKPTVLRRIQRRMGINQITQLSEYVKLVRQNPAEVHALADDLLIHVTGFFRDDSVWETLRKEVIVPIVREREADSEIRCWVTACSSGEEAYTLAMLLVEEAEKIEKPLDIKIFATDTAERSLGHARNGVYPAGIESEITQPRVKRFFEKDDSVYRIKKELRELVVFAPQNVLQDPPFSRLDIITCRNLLIYLEPDMQRRVLSLLHFGLREGGALLLGTSETVTGAEDLFDPIDQKLRLYRRVGPTRHGAVEFPLPFRPRNLEQETNEPRVASRASVSQLTNKILLDHYTPAAVTIDRQHRIVFFHGNVEQYLSLPRGEPTRDLLAVARDSVRGAIRTALNHAISQNESFTVMDGFLDSKDRGQTRIAVTAAPLDARLAPDYYLVSFEDRPTEPTSNPQNGAARPAEEPQIQDELRRMRDELQSTIEELQTSNEELKASNEEVTSVNEELQSTNEELETSKEELQSLNEELTTVNAQLQTKMEELEASTNDLTSLLTSTDIAVVFLDTQFRIRRFTAPVRDLIELIPSDIGRPLSDLAIKFTDPTLLEDAQAVLDKLVPVGREIASQSDRWFLRRVLPYRTTDNHIDGVVITFVDITDRKNSEEHLHRAKLAAEAATRAKDEFLATLSHELRTPLAAISIWTRMIGDAPHNEELLREGLNSIEKSADAQKLLVEDLLDTSRITSGKLRLELRQVPLTQLARAAVDALLPAALEKDVVVEAKIAPDVGTVLADPERLRQIIWNLLSNAVKFTPVNGKVRISLKRFGEMIEILVTDDGQGIDPEFLPHLFSPFRQQDSSSTRRHGGLGLGLAISKQLVELHGGTIHAESLGTGHGAKFTVRLPFPSINASNPIDPQSFSKTTSAQLSKLNDVAILLVEDDLQTRNAMFKLLEKSGARVSAAANAEEALEFFRRTPPALIISDLGLPKTDGCALMRQIREMENLTDRPPAPAIALTAFAREEDRADAVSAGFQRHLVKPIEPDLLLKTVCELIANR